MKCGKKYVTVLLTAVLMTGCFSSCFDFSKNNRIDNNYITYNYIANKDRVVKIDLIDYRPNATKWWDRWERDAIPDYEYIPFDEARVFVQERLPTDENDLFLYDLSLKEVYCFNQKDATSEINTPCGHRPGAAG